MGFVIPGPAAYTLSDDDFMASATELPFSTGETFMAGVASGVHDSPILGTAIKFFSAPRGRGTVMELNPDYTPPLFAPIGLLFPSPLPLTSAIRTRPMTDAEVIASGDTPLNEQQYKASPFYRERIPWDNSMTEKRAKALADYDDDRSVREHIASKRPWVAAAGVLVGGQLDPINYIPPYKWGAIAANTTRLTAIGIKAARAGLESAVKSAAFGYGASFFGAPFGDDVSFKAQISKIATDAAIGSAAKAMGGLFRTSQAGRVEKLTELALTYADGQNAMATLRDATIQLTHNGKVELGQASVDRLHTLDKRVSDTISAQKLLSPAQVSPPPAASVPGSPSYPTIIAGEDKESAVSAFVAQALKQPEQKQALVLRQASGEPVDDAQMLEMARRGYTHVLEAQMVQNALRTGSTTPDTPAWRGQEALTAEDFRLLPEIINNYNEYDRIKTPDGADTIVYLLKIEGGSTYYLSEVRQGHNVLSANKFVKWAPGKGPASLDNIVKTGPGGSVKVMNYRRDRYKPAAAAVEKTGLRMQPGRSEPVSSPQAIKAAAAIGTREKPGDRLRHSGINPDTGAFPEEFELARLMQEGRTGNEYHAAMKTATDNMETAKAWNDTIQAAVAYLI